MAMVEVLVAAYAVLVAALVGSFINLAADRVPRRESLVHPRSHCRSCGRVLNLVDLIPVAGYLVRRGRCATCGVQIGASAPLIECVRADCSLMSPARMSWFSDLSRVCDPSRRLV